MQGLNEYTLKPDVAFSGMLSDTNYRPNLLYRTLAGGKTYQTVASINVTGPITLPRSFTVTVPLTLLDGSNFNAVATVAASSTLNTDAAIEQALAVALQSIPQFDQVAIADASSGGLVIRAKRFNQNPIGAVTTSATGSGDGTIAPPNPTVTAASNVLEIPFGYAVGELATDTATECRLFTSGATILGIALASATTEEDYPPSNVPLSSSTPDRYRSGDTVKILNFRQKGQRVWVLCNGTPTKGGTPHANNTTGQIQVSSTGGTALTGAQFTGRVFGSIVEIEF